MGRELSRAELTLVALGAGIGIADVAGVIDWPLAFALAAVVAWVLVHPLLAVWHELAHAVVARVVGSQGYRLRIGSPPWRARVSLAGIEIEWGRNNRIPEGYFARPLSRRRFAAVAVAGPAGSLALAAGLGLVASGLQATEGFAFYSPSLPQCSRHGSRSTSSFHLRRYRAGGVPRVWQPTRTSYSMQSAGDTGLPIPSPTARVRRSLPPSRGAGAAAVDIERMLLGVLDQPGAAAEILRASCADHGRIGAHSPTPADGVGGFTAGFDHALRRAHAVATELQHPRLDAEHLLFGIVDESNAEAAQTLARLGVHRARVRDATLEHLRAV